MVPLPNYDAEIPDVQNLTGWLSRKDHYRDRSVKNDIKSNGQYVK